MMTHGNSSVPMRTDSNSSSCRLVGSTVRPQYCSRRVIFPSLHSPSSNGNGVTRIQGQPGSPSTTNIPCPVSPDTPPSSSRIHPRHGKNTTLFSVLSSAERDVLLSRLGDAPGSPLSPSPDRNIGASPPTKRYNIDGKPSIPAHLRSSVDSSSPVVQSLLALPPCPVTPLARNEKNQVSSLFSLMLPSFDYLINPYQHHESSLFSVVKLQRSSSVPTSPTRPLVPILRKTSSVLMTRKEERHYRRAMSYSASESSDLPSLTSSISCDSMVEDDTEESSSHLTLHTTTNPTTRREVRAVSFCPRVWVRVFVRSQRERESIWYSPRDMEAFKMEALHCIQEFCAIRQKQPRSIVPTGTGRTITTLSEPDSRLLFSHQALQVDFDLCSSCSDEDMAVCDDTLQEIQRILLVDPREVCLKLLTKSFQLMFPHAVVHVAVNTTEALTLIRQENCSDFDVILVEERLDREGTQHGAMLDSGSTLITRIKKEVVGTPLYIGITSHLEQDMESLRDHGADVVWPKPPPPTSEALRNELLRLLRAKREKATPAQ